MSEKAEDKRRIFIPPLTLEHVLLTELINAPSPVTPQPPKSPLSKLQDVPNLPDCPGVTKKRIAIMELVNNYPADEPPSRCQKLIDDEPLTPDTVGAQRLPSARNECCEDRYYSAVGAGLQTLAALATTSNNHEDRAENKENDHNTRNIDNGNIGNNGYNDDDSENRDKKPTGNTSNTQYRTSAPQLHSIPASPAAPPSPAQKDRKYVCKICNFRFHQAGGLRNHTRAVHLKEKPYGCGWPGCLRSGERGFAARGDLTRHVSSVHKGERNFRCDRCTMRFARRSVLVRHSRNIHGIGKR